MMSARKNATNLQNLLTNEKKILTSLGYNLLIIGYKHPIWWLYSYRNYSNHPCKYYPLEGSSSWLYLWHSSVKSNKPLAQSTFLAKLDTLEHIEMNLIIGLEIQLRASKLLRGGRYWKLWTVSKVLHFFKAIPNLGCPQPRLPDITLMLGFLHRLQTSIVDQP